jgi:glyoxylate reductase
MERKKILVTRILPALANELLTDAGFSVTAWDEDRPMTKEELAVKSKDHDAVLVTATERIDKEFLKLCPHLEIISQYAVGYDNIDIGEATRLGIPVGYTPGAMSDATADVAFGLMIATSRKMFALHKSIIKGEWKFFRPTANLGIELMNKTLGIYGLGRIGMEMARRCQGAYKMKVMYHNRKPNPDAERELNATFVDFETLLAQSDVISVHCSLGDATRGVFNRKAFSQMKPTSIFVNTSRGGVHHEGDLIDALNAGEIWGAGLDVTNPEPMKSDNPLLQMETVAVLPHIGSSTIESRNEMARLAAMNIIEFYKHRVVPHIINPETIK